MLSDKDDTHNSSLAIDKNTLLRTVSSITAPFSMNTDSRNPMCRFTLMFPGSFHCLRSNYKYECTYLCKFASAKLGPASRQAFLRLVMEAVTND